MDAIQTSNYWHRRLSLVAVFVALVVIVSFAAGRIFGTNVTGPTFDVPLVAAGLAAVLLVVAGVSLLRLPSKVKSPLPAVIQILLFAVAATTIHTTGGLYSYFLPLWMPAILLTGLFGMTGISAAAMIPVGYAAWLSHATGTPTLADAMTLALVGGLPLVLSYALFSRLDAAQENSSYRQLANQYSQVSGKSEVVINAISNGVVALDKAGVIELINPAAQRLIGWESRDALKLDYKSVLKLVDDKSNELTPVNDPVYKALSTNEEVRTEDLTLLTNAGKKLQISLVASPVGQPGSGIIIVFRDITKEKAEEREQTEFISTASHEMRTPVATIEGYLGLALNPATAQIDEKARSYITKAHEVAQHLGRLFQDLLDITKADDGRLSNNPRAIEVVSFVQDIVEGLRPQADAKGLILVYKPIPDDGPDEKSNRRLNPVFYANVDNDHFREVVGNLVENAIKYTKQGTVSVDVSGDDKQVQVSVQDTGIGIPSEDIAHLFQKFYRVDNSDTREIGGTGLGLYLSRRLVETMEGRIWVESQHGEGSTFFVSIPRISHQEAMELIETLGEHSEPAAVAPGSFINTPPMQDTSAPVQPAAPQEGVFANPSADDIAAQLSVPASPTPAPQVATQGPTLATIEQNPSQYMRYTGPVPRQAQITPPPRDGQNQS